MNDEWKQIVLELAQLKQELAALGQGDQPPEPPATGDELAELEAQLSAPLNPQYRDFLCVANGWNECAASARIFGTNDLLGRTDFMRHAAELLRAYNPDGCFPQDEPGEGRTGNMPPLEVVRNEDVLPIGISTWYLSMVFMGKEETPIAGQILHIVGSSISRHENLESFFRSIITYDRMRIDVVKNPGEPERG